MEEISRGRGRPKGSFNKKTLDSMKHLADSVDTAPKSSNELDSLRKLIEAQNTKIEELNNKLTKNQELSVIGEIESNVDLNKLSDTVLMSNEDVKKAESQIEIAVRELEGYRNTFLSLGGGDYNAFERKTGSRVQLKKRIVNAKRALANEAPPKVTDIERDRLLKRHQELARELAPLVASERDQWDSKNDHGHFQDAIDSAMILSTEYSRKVREWQNIGKILDPSDKSLWSLNKLRSSYKN